MLWLEKSFWKQVCSSEVYSYWLKFFQEAPEMQRGRQPCLLQAFLAALCVASKNISTKDVAVDQASLQEEILEMFDANMAVAMSRFAALTYCGRDLDLEVVESCPECADAGFEVVKGSVEELSLSMTYSFKTYRDANYFLLGELQFLSSEDKACFVATRGSAKHVNWMQNKMQNFVDPKFVDCPGCRLHQGYFSIYEGAIGKFKEYFDRHGCGMSEKPIYVTGHSLGGAMGSIFIAGLTSEGYKVALSYILEPALAGNQAFRDYFLHTISKSHPPVPVFSLSNGWDMVPGLPRPLSLGYRRIPYDIHSDPSVGALTVCFHDGEDSDLCRVNTNSWWYKKSMAIDHIVLWYAPGHMQALVPFVPEACKANPNWFKLRGEWMLVGLYTTFVGSGVWNFSFKVVLTLLCLSSVCCCFCCCRGSSWYKVLPREEGEASNRHYEATFGGLISDLTSRIAARSAETETPAPPNPTLLTGSATTSGQRAEKTIVV